LINTGSILEETQASVVYSDENFEALNGLAPGGLGEAPTSRNV